VAIGMGSGIAGKGHLKTTATQQRKCINNVYEVVGIAYAEFFETDDDRIVRVGCQNVRTGKENRCNFPCVGWGSSI